MKRSSTPNESSTPCWLIFTDEDELDDDDDDPEPVAIGGAELKEARRLKLMRTLVMRLRLMIRTKKKSLAKMTTKQSCWRWATLTRISWRSQVTSMKRTTLGVDRWRRRR